MKLNCAYVGRVTWRRIKGEMLWLLLPCGSLRGKIARNVSTFNFNGPPVPPMVSNLSDTVLQLQVLNEVLEKAQGELGPQWHEKTETLEQETAHCLISELPEPPRTTSTVRSRN